MNLIVAVDDNWAIACNGDLIYYAPEDKKFFRDKTKGNVVVMGRSTLESLPGGKPLADRINVVLTTNREYCPEGVEVLNSIPQLLDYLKEYNSEDVYIIGGKMVYEELMDHCDTAYVTKFKHTHEADLYLKNMDTLDNWECVETFGEYEYKDLKFDFNVYRNNKVIE